VSSILADIYWAGLLLSEILSAVDIYWAGLLLPEILMILFTQSTAVLHKYLNDELKYFVCDNFSLRFHRIPGEFHEFSMFREIPEYSRFSRFVATLPSNVTVRKLRQRNKIHKKQTLTHHISTHIRQTPYNA